VALQQVFFSQYLGSDDSEGYVHTLFASATLQEVQIESLEYGRYDKWKYIYVSIKWHMILIAWQISCERDRVLVSVYQEIMSINGFISWALGGYITPQSVLWCLENS
jgi:hypothetical protein